MSIIYNTESEITVSIRYNETADAEVLNQQIDNLFKKGVYYHTDPLIVAESDSSIIINPFTLIIRQENATYIDSKTKAERVADLSIKATIKTIGTISSVNYLKPYIVAELWSPVSETVGYRQDTQLTVRVRAVSGAERDLDNQILLGKLLFKDGTGVQDDLYDVDYVRSLQKSPQYDAETWLAQFIAHVTGKNQITISGGYLEGVKVESLVVNYNTPTYPWPSPGHHRFDLAYVDESTNTLVLRKGTEEAGGENEDPKPNPINLATYSFPVAMIYIPNRLRSGGSFDEECIYNVLPRFSRKPTKGDEGIANYIIKSVAEWEAYFGVEEGTTPELNEGGETSGSFDDGFPCEYANGVKTVYPKRGRYEIRNIYDPITGAIIKYPVWTRIKLPSGFQLISGNDVVFDYKKSYSSFEVTNDSDILLMSASGNEITVKEEDNHVADIYSERYGDYLHPETWDSISFSDTTVRENNYVDSLIRKEKSVDIIPEIVSLPTLSVQYSVHVGADLYVAYADSNKLFLQKYICQLI